MSAAAQWHPPIGLDARQEPVGIAWDAVRAPAHIAGHAAQLLDAACGAVICDQFCNDWYWLIPPGSAATWQWIADVEVYGPACWIVVPTADRFHGPGHYWIPGPTGQLITDAGELHAALSVAVRHLYGPTAPPPSPLYERWAVLDGGRTAPSK